jgi:hypothetical protein
MSLEQRFIVTLIAAGGRSSARDLIATVNRQGVIMWGGPQPWRVPASLR